MSHAYPQPAPEPADPTLPFRRAIFALLEAGRALLARIHTPHTPTDALPQGYRLKPLPARFAANPARAAQRLTRTLGWVVALAQTLAGNRFYCRPAPRPPAPPPSRPPRPHLTNALRDAIGLPPPPPSTQLQRDAAHLRYIRRTFATTPTAIIARRLARRLGLKPNDDAWPSPLLAIAEPPALWAATAHAPRPAQHPQNPPEPPPASATPASHPAAPAFHRRE